MNSRKLAAVLCLATLVTLLAPRTEATNTNQDVVTRFYVVRHAEKVDESRDPDLSDAGKERAQALAARLADAEVTAVYSTPYKRTKQTAGPLAEQAKLELQEFPPPRPGEEALAWAKEVISNNTGKNVLVVAHSGRPDQHGSVPSLVSAMAGGQDVEELKDEYFHLYIVTLRTVDGQAQKPEVKREKFGKVPDDAK